MFLVPVVVVVLLDTVLRHSRWQTYRVAGEAMLTVYLPYAALVLIALAAYVLLNWRHRFVAMALILGPFTLARPVVALTGALVAAWWTRDVMAAGLALAAAVAVLTVEPAVGRLWYRVSSPAERLRALAAGLPLPGVSRRLSALVAATGALAGLAAAALTGLSHLGFLVDEDAVTQARLAYQQRSELRGLGVERAEGWSDCAVVQLNGVPRRGVVSLVMVQRAGRWQVARVESEHDVFDPDSVSDEEGCRGIAASAPRSLSTSRETGRTASWQAGRTRPAQLTAWAPHPPS